MKTLLVSHTDCLLHDTGPSHPERPDRLRAVLHAFRDKEFDSLSRTDAPLATKHQLTLAHPDWYIEQIEQSSPSSGLINLDGDTVMSPGSLEAALRAAGAVCAAVDAVFDGQADNAFCAVRPPGHHAEPDRAMGFCLFNNVVVGAHHARDRHGIRRVAVIDFDVHHGNGTQAMFAADADLFYASTHQWPLYPGSGRPDERGVGNIVNVCLPPGAGSSDFRAAMTDQILPALRQFDPELIMISAGFDAHAADPLANLDLQDEDFGWITAELKGLAAACCAGRLVSTLEGGYDLTALGSAARAHVKALMGNQE